MKSILVAIPSYSGLIPLELMSRIITLDKPKGFIINFAYVERCFIDMARNGIAKQCLMHSDDYLFFVDDDTIPPKDVLVRMVELDKDIVGCPVPNRKGGDQIAVLDEEFNHLKEIRETKKVGAVGMSSTLIKADVLKKMFAIYPNPFQFESLVQFESLEAKGELTNFSEDTNFCRRANELGLETWCIHDICPVHLGDQMRYQYR